MRTAAAALCLILTAAGCAGSDADDGPAAQTTVERLGPYDVAGDRYTVELTTLRAGDDESVLRVRILDAAGVAHVEMSHDEPAAAGAGLDATVSVVPWVLEGASGSALLLITEQQPSAPLTGVSYAVFAPRDGRLVALWPPLAPYGDVVELRTDRDGTRRLADGDALTVELWRYHYGARVPLRLDLDCEPGSATCVEPQPASREPISGYGVYAVRTDLRPVAEDGFVTLHEAPGSDLSDRVPVRRDSSVEVLEAALDLELRFGQALELAPRDEWLRVRIDGRDGWISTPQSFEAIGLTGAR